MCNRLPISAMHDELGGLVFPHCPRCGHAKPGGNILQCGACLALCCAACRPGRNNRFTRCPACGYTRRALWGPFTVLGRIGETDAMPDLDPYRRMAAAMQQIHADLAEIRAIYERMLAEKGITHVSRR